MALTYGFFNSLNGDRVYNADQIGNMFDGLISNGIYENIGDAFIVRAAGGMNVTVGSGRAFVGKKWAFNDAAVTVEISAANASLNRYTAVVLRRSMTTRDVVITTIDGTPAANPVKPAIVRDSTTYDLCLAMIYVAAGATALSQANISDTRAGDRCGWVTGIVKQVPTGDLFAQWQTAYEEFYASFQSWFDTLTRQLQVNTYISAYDKTVTPATGSGAVVVPLDMDGYTYEAGDILFVYVNGLITKDYTLDASVPAVSVTFTRNTGTTNEIFIRVLKSKIGDPVSGGSTFEQMEITEGVSSNSTIVVSGEVE